MAIQSIGNGRIEYTQPGTRQDQTVREVQRALNYLAGARVVPENGAFDRYTFDAIRKFQHANSAQGLNPTGVIDQRTIDVMNRELSRRSGSPQTVLSGPSQVHPADAQAKGFDSNLGATAGRAQMWAREGPVRQAHYMGPNPGRGFSDAGGNMARIERDSRTAGARADLMMNTNEAWTALRAGGRNPVRDLESVLADKNALQAAERHLNRVAQGLARDHGPEGYQSMAEEDRLKLWVTALLTNPAAGQRVLGQLTTDESRQQGLADLQAARDALLRANPDAQSTALVNQLYERQRLVSEATAG